MNFHSLYVFAFLLFAIFLFVSLFVHTDFKFYVIDFIEGILEKLETEMEEVDREIEEDEKEELMEKSDEK